MIYSRLLKRALCRVINPLPDNKILTLSKLNASFDDNFIVAKMVQFFSDKIENNVEKEEMLGFHLFSQCFQKSSFFRVMKTSDCLGKG